MPQFQTSTLMICALSAVLSPTPGWGTQGPQAGGAQGFAGQPLGAGYLVQFSLGLLAVLAAVVALAWLLKRVGHLQGGAAGAVKTLGALSLGPRERVVLIQVGKEQLLVGVAPGQVRTLHVLDHPVELSPASGREMGPGVFSRRLAAALGRPGSCLDPQK